MLLFLQDSVSDVLELLKRQEDLEAMIQAQNDRFTALQKKKTQVGRPAATGNRSYKYRRRFLSQCLFLIPEREEAGSSWSRGTTSSGQSFLPEE